jgi:hypothetical protein
MKKLNPQLLKAGDIILTSGPNKVSKAVRRITKSEISHAMVYVQHASVIDATAHGVHSSNLQRLFLEDDAVVVVLRHRTPLRAEVIRRVTDFARAASGTEYSKKEAMAVVARTMRRTGSRKQFCSRLAAQAYAFAGISLVPDPDYCSPEDLRTSGYLVEIPDVELPASDQEVAFWETRANTLTAMSEATNAVLRAARRRSNSIQSLNDIIGYLLAHPNEDHHVRRAYEKSGYLTVWQLELTKSGWQYDLDLMRATIERDPAGAASMEEYCQELLADLEGGRRFEINYSGYLELANRTGLSTFRVLAELYAQLMALHRMRVETARAWLAESAGNT